MLVRCEKCGGNVDVARLRTPRTGDVELAGVFSLEISSVEARVCTNCGYIELYAMQPSEVSGPEVKAEPQYGFYDE